MFSRLSSRTASALSAPIRSRSILHSSRLFHSLRPLSSSSFSSSLRTSSCISSSCSSSSHRFARHFSHSEDDFIVTVGTKSAPFTAQGVVNGAIKTVNYPEDFEQKWVILLFYPLDWTFVCPTELIAFSDRISEFRALNAEVIGISVDSQFSHLAWIKTPRENGGLGQMNIPIVADLTHDIAQNYGTYKADEGIAYRGLFILDPSKKCRQVTINDLPIGRSVDETLRLLKAFQFHEAHGEVCPADWQEGKDSMKADPEGSKTYFRKTHAKK